MNAALLKKAIPHIVAIVIFLLIAIIYCKPALEGKVVNQSDVTHWKGAIHESEEYAKTHGHYPLWTNSVFSGMPTFQIGGSAGNFIATYAHTILTLGLPEPIQFFFLACICFYFLCMVLRIHPYTAILGALAFAYATYNPVIISAGHNTKMWSIAYMPALLGAVILVYEKKYWLGAALIAIFSSLLIAMNHLQIAYYLFLVIAIMSIIYGIRFIKNKEWKHLALAAGIVIATTTIGVLSNAVNIFTTYEYQKYTIRGGSSVLKDSVQVHKSDNGLEKDYAFSYSLKLPEPLVMMVPRMYGGSNGNPEVASEKSKAVEAISALPQQLQQQLPLTYYWGGLIETGLGTSGPPYLGAIICFLAILGFFIVDSRHKWWILIASALSIFISWGSYFDGFNTLLYEYLPLYNKFRAPSMALVIPQLLFPILAVMGLETLSGKTDQKLQLPKFKKALIATGVVFAVLLLTSFSVDYLAKGDKALLRQVGGMNQPQLLEAVNSFFDGLKEDRQSLMNNDILRSFGFIAVAIVLVFLLIKRTIKPVLAIAGLTLFCFIDLITIDSNYLTGSQYVEKEENVLPFQKTAADNALLADTSYYRVFNVSGDPFSENITSYFYKSVGGYHAAKLRIYSDLIDRQLRKQNMAVFNMLNTKYFLQRDQNRQTQNYQLNPGALGPVWFVKTIQFVKGPDEEMAALDNFNPADTAFVQDAFKSSIPFQPQPDSNASIRLVKNENDIIHYTSNSATNQFAVFSEIYYDAGWVAYIDGKESPIVKVNYVLRGLAVPAGKHDIRFEFKPRSHAIGKTLTTVCSVLILLLILAVAGMTWRKNR